jgi:D-threonate/D-erythronate kinase
MIAVVADDLTGAAEIGGIAWRSGYTVEIRDWRCSIGTKPPTVVVWNTASRLVPPREAVRRVRQVCESIRQSGPGRVFKKVDSVLRGNVAAEVRAMSDALGLEGCLLVPVNPSRGRTLEEGTMLVDGTSLDRTDFRRDPHHPRLSAKAVDLLGGTRRRFVLERLGRGPLPAGGWRIGDAASRLDVRRWAKRIGSGTLAAGGADFFDAWLPKASGDAGTKRKRLGWPTLGRILFVCGSRSSTSREFLSDAARRGWPVCQMPRAVARGRGSATSRAALAWGIQVEGLGRDHSRVALTIGSHRGVRSDLLCERLVRHAVASVAVLRPDTVGVEGGATAERLLEEIGVGTLSVVGEMAPGIVVLGVNRTEWPRLVLKPGSYPWPGGMAQDQDA